MGQLHPPPCRGVPDDHPTAGPAGGNLYFRRRSGRRISRRVPNPVSGVLRLVAGGLARAGVIDDRRGRRATELAWPRILTGFARLSQQAADVAMVGLVLGPAAIAGVGFALAYWDLGNRLSLGLSGGTISQVSRRFGADDDEGIDLAVKQSVWTMLLLTLPIAAVLAAFPRTAITLLSEDPMAAAHGTTYLQVVSFAVIFEALNKIGSRTLVGADDAWTPMVIRAGGAVVNIVLNAVLIFVFDMGVLGAAIGTFTATAFVTVAFAAGLLLGRLPGVGPFPVRILPTAPYWDSGMGRELLQISLPLVARRISATVAMFPLLTIAAQFGPIVVAAFVVSRRVRALLNAPTWGFGLASSSLVGQELGRGDEDEAERFGWDILWFSLAIYLVSASLVLVFAGPVARVFVTDPAALDQTEVFIRVGAVSVVGLGIDGAATGALRAGGDTNWPFYGNLLGLYGFALPIAFLGVLTPVGILALYVSLVAETMVPAAVSFYRFNTGTWLEVSRRYGAGQAG